MDNTLVDQPAGQWTLPKTKEIATEECTSTNINDLFHCIVTTSPFYKQISNQKYIELLKSMTETINRGWKLWPQLRFAVSQLFAEAILVEQSSAILINCIEPYGRLKSTDAHYERRLTSTMHQSSYPKNECQYGWITTAATQEDNTTKLRIGITTCNLLVTSSMRLDKGANTQGIIEMRSNTTNFVPTKNAVIYVNTVAIRLANLLIENESTICINEEN